MSDAKVEIKIGQRIVLIMEVDRYPYFIAPRMATGTVTEVSNRHITAKMDQLIEGAETWGNCIVWASQQQKEAPTQFVKDFIADTKFI